MGNKSTNQPVEHANKTGSHHNPPRGLFVTGTDTEVGKTFVACKLIQYLVESGVRVGAYKPVASGISDGFPSDPQRLLTALRPQVDRVDESELRRVCPQQFAAPLAPPMAAAAEGKSVQEDLLVRGADAWTGECDYLLVEGAGGWLSPISQTLTNADLASRLRLPVLIVAANRLGVVNHTLLTIESIQSRGLKVSGVILNTIPTNADDCSTRSNFELLKGFCDLPIVAFDAHLPERIGDLSWVDLFT